jgi:hypothetical protein
LYSGDFVDGAIAAAAFRRVHTGGASVITGAICDQVTSRAEQYLDAVEHAGGEAYATGLSVVEKNGRVPDLWVAGVRDAGDIVAVAEGEEREQG